MLYDIAYLAPNKGTHFVDNAPQPQQNLDTYYVKSYVGLLECGSTYSARKKSRTCITHNKLPY